MTWACSKSSEVLNLILSLCMLGSSIKHDLFLDVHFRSETILIFFVWNYFTCNSKQGNWHEPRARGTQHGSRLVPFRDTRSFSVSIRLLLVARGEHIDGSSMLYHNQVTQKELLESIMQIWEAFFLAARVNQFSGYNLKGVWVSHWFSLTACAKNVKTFISRIFFKI